VTRAEHLRWAKDRALEYADMGDVSQAMASLGSDLNKHPETKDHGGMELMMMMAMAGQLDQPGELRKFIEGFN
jgi:TorA maturation chaperone TorD